MVPESPSRPDPSPDARSRVEAEAALSAARPAEIAALDEKQRFALAS
jgi:hypothetical protein